MAERTEDSIQEMADLIREYVKAVEESTAMTQNHYDQYMSMMSRLTDDRTQALVLVDMLKAAGANHAGVDAALKVTYG